MMERCWLGETNFDFDHEKYGAPPNATAVQVRAPYCCRMTLPAMAR